ncbi:SHOCT domain-containing protein [Frankia sp. AvcI1]|uniref:SHOCT domain-containing protein n=1 Tax=Frankia sp. AvcI1 TaxID=573496 RepID=UPI000B1768B6|nr:SHOCT domain-containing protein [Frankia sp. AvcI1]
MGDTWGGTMRTLTSQGERAVADLCARYAVSTDAVYALLEAVRRGNGTMAQFSHPEFGGAGQWMAGGMTMIGDMGNHGLQATVSGLASELAALLAATPLYAPAAAAGPVSAGEPGSVHPANRGMAEPGIWWPDELGRPRASGGQNDTRYAVFPQLRRLAVQSGGGPVRVYDTLDHSIGGVHQQQGAAPGTLSFTSQHGTVTVDSLPMASPPPTTSPGVEPPTGPPAPSTAPVSSTANDRERFTHRRTGVGRGGCGRAAAVSGALRLGWGGPGRSRAGQ